MQPEAKSQKRNNTEKADTYVFVRKDGRWYADLDPDPKQNWIKKDLELREGAHKVLTMLANSSDKVMLRLSLDAFAESDVLELVEHCAAPKGGGIYLYHSQIEWNSGMYWICDLVLFVFGDVPERIYVKRLPLPAEERVNSKVIKTKQGVQAAAATGTGSCTHCNKGSIK